MTDIVTEFINVAGKKYADLKAGVTIVSNTSAETAVLRDITVANPKGRAISLMVGPSEIAAIDSTTSLSGTELLGASTSMVLTTKSTPVLNQYLSLAALASFYPATISIGTVWAGEQAKPGPAAKSVAGGLVYLLSIPYFACFDSAGNFYYSSNGASASSNNVGRLYRRAGGINGTETSISMSSAPGSYDSCYAWDGVRYIYAMQSGGILSRYDTQTGVTSAPIGTSVTGFESTTGTLTAIDGFLVVHPTYGATHIFIVNGSNGSASSSISVAANPGASSNCTLAVGKDSTGNYILFYGYNNSLFWYNYGPVMSTSLTSPFSAGTVQGAVSTMSLYSQYAGRLHRSEASPDTMFYFGDNTIIQIDVNNKTAYNITPIGTPNFSSVAILPVSSELVDTDFGSIDIRATGIKTT